MTEQIAVAALFAVLAAAALVQTMRLDRERERRRRLARDYARARHNLALAEFSMAMRNCDADLGRKLRPALQRTVKSAADMAWTMDRFRQSMRQTDQGRAALAQLDDWASQQRQDTPDD